MDVSDRTAAERLALEAMDVWQRATADVPTVVVRPAIPILYFGDLTAYLASPMRVITVGLNPSREEFPTGDRYRRFPRARNLDSAGGRRLLTALNDYFVTDPYRSWFGTFEPILNGLGVSYYPGSRSTALHTDLCSPIATDPTWSRLDADSGTNLIATGRPLWHDLIRFLQPDVVLISVARHHLEGISFEPKGDWAEIHRLTRGRARPYSFQVRWVNISAHKSSLLVFGQAAQRPFGESR